MGSNSVQGLCVDCLKNDSCEYMPATGGRLLRCLDRQTETESLQSMSQGSEDSPGSSFIESPALD
ncbi:MAG: hypothetical protein NTZ78_07695 [Candidatus Aureabacteria bacterium]|nr:hypothetical protein [Candidatus Auribacterota bacterium]